MTARHFRDLGDAEPGSAPMHKPPPPPVPAVVINPGERRSSVTIPQYTQTSADNSQWLIHFIAIAIFLGALAILAITLLQ